MTPPIRRLGFYLKKYPLSSVNALTSGTLRHKLFTSFELRYHRPHINDVRKGRKKQIC